MSGRFGGPQPQPPHPSIAVLQWLDERIVAPAVAFTELRKLASDAPTEIREFVEAHLAYVDAHREWAKQQPVDEAADRWATRFFGGEWIDRREPGVRQSTAMDCLVGDIGISVNVAELLMQLDEANAPEDVMRRIAGAFYEWRAVDRKARAALGALCLEAIRKFLRKDGGE